MNPLEERGLFLVAGTFLKWAISIVIFVVILILVNFLF
jgi:hypothetical protein